MKCVVIYFSMTGNTELVAQAIQVGIKQAAGNCDIFPIKEANPRRLREYDLIGFGFPVMAAPSLQNVANFIKDMVFVGGKHVFQFNTADSGAVSPHFIPKLRNRGLTVIGWNCWLGAGYGPLAEPTPSSADGHPDEIDLQEAEAFGREMVWRSQRIYKGETSLIPEGLPEQRYGPPEGAENPALAGSQSDSIGEWMKRNHWRLIYDREKCLYPKCTLCMDFCPMYGIDLTMNPPVIGNPCMTCMMCDQLCPTGAILVDEAQMKWQEEIEGYGENYRNRLEWRKDHPRVYVPKEEVIRGFKDVVYKTYPKHPRFVIGLGRPYGVDPRRSWKEIQED